MKIKDVIEKLQRCDPEDDLIWMGEFADEEIEITHLIKELGTANIFATSLEETENISADQSLTQFRIL